MNDRLVLLRDLGFFPRTVLDIGAFEGEFTRLIQSIWPESSVFMVEANKDCEEKLAKVKGARGYAIALLGEKGENAVEYYKTKKIIPTGNSVYKENSSYFEDCEVVKLPMVTLDNLVTAGKLVDIDFLKIDTQGSEIAILKGGEKVLTKAEFVLLETQVLVYNSGAPMIEEVISFMSQKGFKVFDVLDVTYLPTGQMAQMDILFVRKNSKFIKRGELL